MNTNWTKLADNLAPEVLRDSESNPQRTLWLWNGRGVLPGCAVREHPAAGLMFMDDRGGRIEHVTQWMRRRSGDEPPTPPV